VINEDVLRSATIEEYVIGTYFNLNYFYSPIRGETEFLGIERRLQTNIHDFVTSVPAKQQMEIDLELQNIEVGHTPAYVNRYSIRFLKWATISQSRENIRLE
jgi:5-formaminoimidazole-4-carboxamide-1-(beta)-D-ribofuranosyl 5'-monophosphate synthetase